MTFGTPYLLLTLLVLPAAFLAYRLAQRRRMRYAVRYTNVDVLAAVAGPVQKRRLIAPLLFLLAVATLCVAVARPHISTMVGRENATVVMVLDVSGSMRANDVKPSRLDAAEQAIRIFLKRVPPRVRVALILFAGEAEVAAPPTTDHELVAQSVNDADIFPGFGGTAIGDALAAAVKLAQQATNAQGTRGLTSYHPDAVPAAEPKVASSLVSILFLSDGHQTRGQLLPLQGAALARRAGIPVYTVALGTPNGKITNFPQFGGGGVPGGGGVQGGGFFRRGLAPDPATLHAIARQTGGKFYEARSAGAVKDAYAKLGSSLARVPGHREVTDAFIGGAALLLLLALGLSTIWAPRLP
jgi:Ca-activated chloride channel family protein